MNDIKAAIDLFTLEFIDVCNRLKADAKSICQPDMASTFAILELLKSESITESLALHELKELFDYTDVLGQQIDQATSTSALQAA
jgi:hypothetical protein